MTHYAPSARYSSDPAIVAAMAKVEAAQKQLNDAIRELREATIGSPLIGHYQPANTVNTVNTVSNTPQHQQNSVQTPQQHYSVPQQTPQPPQTPIVTASLEPAGVTGLAPLERPDPSNDTRLAPVNPFHNVRAKSPEYKYPLSRERMMKLMGATDKSMVYDMKAHVRNKCIELGYPLDKLFSQWDEVLLARLIATVHKEVSSKYGWKESTTRLVMMTICQDKVRNEKVKERKRKGLVGSTPQKAQDGSLAKKTLEGGVEANKDTSGGGRGTDDEESEMDIGAQQHFTHANAGQGATTEAYRASWHNNGQSEYSNHLSNFNIQDGLLSPAQPQSNQSTLPPPQQMSSDPSRTLLMHLKAAVDGPSTLPSSLPPVNQASALPKPRRGRPPKDRTRIENDVSSIAGLIG